MSNEEVQFIYDNYFERLVDMAERITRDYESARDIVQEVVAYCSDKEYAEERIRPLLFVSTKNRCIDYVRAKKTSDRRLNDYNYLTQNHFDNDYLDTLYLLNMLEKCPPQQAKIIYLTYFKKMKSGQIADLLQITIHSVFVLRSRAIKSLRKIIYDKKISHDTISS